MGPEQSGPGATGGRLSRDDVSIIVEAIRGQNRPEQVEAHLEARGCVRDEGNVAPGRGDKHVLALFRDFPILVLLAARPSETRVKVHGRSQNPVLADFYFHVLHGVISVGFCPLWARIVRAR